MNKKKVIFIADAFAHQHTGGAELHDAVVIDFFKQQDLLHEIKNTMEISTTYVSEHKDKIWFISNFVALKNVCKALLAKECEYYIYEHDYKFSKVRNPIGFPDFLCPKGDLMNLNFYAAAKKVICLSKMHREIFDKNLNLDNIENINCSMWSDKQLELFRRLQKPHKNGKFAVIKTGNPTKRMPQTIEFCRGRNIPFDLIASQNYEEFINILSNYNGLAFMTGHPEPTPRVAIEAKMLNCKFLAPKKLISVAHEDYFHLTGLDMIEEVRKMRDEALNKFIGWFSEA
jgi:hypothetical protein